jgi:hypothetical protein
MLGGHANRCSRKRSDGHCSYSGRVYRMFTSLSKGPRKPFRRALSLSCCADERVCCWWNGCGKSGIKWCRVFVPCLSGVSSHVFLRTGSRAGTARCPLAPCRRPQRTLANTTGATVVDLAPPAQVSPGSRTTPRPVGHSTTPRSRNNSSVPTLAHANAFPIGYCPSESACPRQTTSIPTRVHANGLTPSVP